MNLFLAILVLFTVTLLIVGFLLIYSLVVEGLDVPVKTKIFKGRDKTIKTPIQQRMDNQPNLKGY